MNRRTPLALLIAVLLPVVALAADEPPSVAVTTRPLEKAVLAETLTRYGVVNPGGGEVTALSLPYAAQVTRLRVTPGQRVARGAALLEYDSDPAAVMTYRQAQTAVELARGELERTQRLLTDHLATQSQLAAAQKALADAQSALDAQRAAGAPSGHGIVVAAYEGLVSSIAVGPGDRPAAGATLMQLSREGTLQVLLGIEPQDRERVHAGLPVRIESVFGGAQGVDARIDSMQGMVDAQTQMVGAVVRVAVDAAHGLIPGMKVRGVISVAQAESWVVPRNAVLADDAGSYLFQVGGGHAHRVAVEPGIDGGERLGVSGKLDPALPVVVLGNYELQDGAPVREAAQ